MEILAVLILPVLLTASYIYRKRSYRNSFLLVLLPSPSLSFPTIPTTFRHIASPNPLTVSNTSEFSLPEHS